MHEKLRVYFHFGAKLLFNVSKENEKKGRCMKGRE